MQITTGLFVQNDALVDFLMAVFQYAILFKAQTDLLWAPLMLAQQAFHQVPTTHCKTASVVVLLTLKVKPLNLYRR